MKPAYTNPSSFSFFILVLSIVTLIPGNVFSQTSGGILITDDTNYTISDNAALDVYSANKKGLLIPRISYNQMLAMQPLKDGLMVYVTDADNQGFWYWDSIEDSEEVDPQGEWVKLRDGSDPEPVKAPYNSIVMYSGPLAYFENTDPNTIGAGKPGTIMEGWYLCNGKNGTPDLTGKFVAGYLAGNADYATIGQTGGIDSLKIETSELPKHSHSGAAGQMSISHTHTVVDYGHEHTVNVVYGSTGDPVRICSREEPSSHAAGEITIGESALNLGESTSQAATSISLTFPPNYILNEGGNPDGSTAKIENRPNYYVLAFIMRKQ